ncbi:MAG: helix-turn-helix domain-containing protein, partial [Nanoarchaeota archaeon]|nr:helix-turn-helix domain-containing protein [Nanoarchaeota archaeon]
LKNYKTQEPGKGMPLGNLTSQFFANVYLNELDQFVKHKLNAPYYIRYVDDFVIVHSSCEQLEKYKLEIQHFLHEKLKLQLHPDKSKVLRFTDGVSFLGHRIYPYYKRITKKNIRRFERKLMRLHTLYKDHGLPREKVVECFEGWLAHISHANTFKYRQHMLRMFNQLFPLEPKINPLKLTNHQNFVRKIQESFLQFSVQKTLYLYKKRRTIIQIAQERSIKVGTVWGHIANLIEYNQLSVWKILPKEKVTLILSSIKSEHDLLKDIKVRCKDTSITYDEINCTLAYVKGKNRKKNIMHHIHWYQKVHCLRKCYFNKNQRNICALKFTTFQSSNPLLEMKRDEFLHLFNNHMDICVLPQREKLMQVSWDQFQNMKNYRLQMTRSSK